MSSETITIQADPRKRFFIEMLTRDISLVDCILDLIDNSVDSVLNKTKFDPMKGLTKEERKRLEKYEISINFSKSKFSIEDNAEGVTEDVVKDKVFRFGAEGKTDKKLGLSVYGIGMKRAFFKIGKTVDFESVSKTGKVSVQLNVDKWVKAEPWNLEGKSEKSKKKNTDLGTKIIVKDINEEVSANFDNLAFETRLIEKIQTTYGIFLDYGLVIKVNDKKASPRIPSVATSGKVKPSSKLLNKNHVAIKIVAGISQDDDKRSNGWFIFCNGRMILEGDKTVNTGWGNGLRKFHASTNRFVGFVYFRSDDVNLLPWTTTKNGVNYESVIYQYALGQMTTIAKPIVNFLTKQYQKDKTLKAVDGLLEGSKEKPISEITKKDTLFSVSASALVAKNGQELVQYTVPVKDIERAKKALEDDQISTSEIGKKSFYYFLEHEE